MEGQGAFTVVDGHKMTLGPNDFVLTPNGTWHEHGVAAEGSTCIWQDGLDIPLVNAFEAGFYAVHSDLNQQVTHRGAMGARRRAHPVPVRRAHARGVQGRQPAGCPAHAGWPAGAGGCRALCGSERLQLEGVP